MDAPRADDQFWYEDQSPFLARFDWGADGLAALAPGVAVVVVVDVLSFATAVSVAVGRGAAVMPCATRDQAAERLARSWGASFATARTDVRPDQPYSLSPATLTRLAAGDRLVLPSPNGSRISALAASQVGTVFAGCLRNASAVGRAAREVADGQPVAVIAAGERRRGGAGNVRPAVEDLIGAGAILAAMGGDAPSPEAVVAMAAFRAVAADLPRFLAGCASGRELIGSGFAQDVAMASALDADPVAPALRDGVFVPR